MFVNARNLYKSCLNEDDTSKQDVDIIASVINNELGGWPIAQGLSWTDRTYDLLSLLVTSRTYDNSVFFSVETSPDPENSTKPIIKVEE
jgi:hypothetical protein